MTKRLRNMEIPNNETGPVATDPAVSLGSGQLVPPAPSDALGPLPCGDVLHYFPDDPLVPARPEEPARRLPKYVPNVDGGYSIIYEDPFIVEMNTDSEIEEEPPVPMSSLLDPRERKRVVFDENTIQIPLLRFLLKLFVKVLFTINTLSIGKVIYRMWQNYNNRDKMREALPDSDSDEIY